MASKLTFNDIKYAELDPSKLNYDATTPAALGTGLVDPSTDAVVGAFYINTVSGDLFRKISAGASASAWRKISSINTFILQNRYRKSNINSAITATDTTGPAIGDLVGFCGVGAWTVGTVLSGTRTNATGGGSQNASLVAGGQTIGVPFNTVELFNGSSWSAGNALITARQLAAGEGSQNAAFVIGGRTNNSTNATSLGELFNGATWSAGPALSTLKLSMASFGVQNAALIAGGQTDNGKSNVVELFNGNTWFAGAALSVVKSEAGGFGSQNAGLIAGGFSVASGNAASYTELFNGTTWSAGPAMNAARCGMASLGSQSAGLVAGGITTALSSTKTTELFNGSSWSLSGDLAGPKDGMAGSGSQNAGLIAGGGAGGLPSTATELHSQTIFRKIYGKNITEAKSIGILATASSVTLQGHNASITYPINKYLILNRSQNSAVTNYVNTAAIPFVSVQGTAPTMTYNFSTTVNLLSVLPGNVIMVTSSGDALNTGSFIISRVISPSSIEVQNASGVAENPVTGTLSILNSMIAVDSISPQDIVIGRTDSLGNLTIARPLVVGSLLKRLK